MSSLDKPQLTAKFDKSNMMKLLLDFTEQAGQAIEIGKAASLPSIDTHNIQNVVINGMGGSAIGGDLIRCGLTDRIKVPVFVNRNYTLPRFVSDKSLVFVCSYSGNTEETLSSFSLALERGAKVIAVSSNGKLEKLSKEKNLPFAKIPGGLPPRCALGYSFFPVLVMLGRLNFIDLSEDELSGILSVLEEIKRECSPQIKTADNPAKNIALKIFNKLAVIYAWADYYEVAAYRFRCQLAENSKHMSSHHTVPEMNHNEIMGWAYPPSLLKQMEVIFLMDESQHDRITKRVEILAPVIEKKAHEVVKIFARGENLLAKIFSLIYTCDFVSFYLAILNAVDPTPVDTISYLKERLSDK